MTNLLKTMEELALLPGISGDEGAVAKYITDSIKNHCDYKMDNLGNIIAYKKGKNRAANTLLLSAHMDEIGLIITQITEGGQLRFDTVGGIDASVLAGRKVHVGPQQVVGVVSMKPIHLMEKAERERPLEKDQLSIDIGAENRAQAESHVSLGDSAVLEGDYTQYGDGLIACKALDDRAGCAILISLIKEDLPCDCVFSFTVQEEVGGQGARAVANAVKPDIAIAVEATTAADIGTTPKTQRVCALREGPVLSFMDRGTIYDKQLFTTALEVAKEHKIPCQTKQGIFGGNESRMIQTAGEGVRVLAVSLPCRYIHSPYCVLAKEDIAPTKALLQQLIAVFGKEPHKA